MATDLTDILKRLEKNMEANASLTEIKIEKNSFTPVQYAVSRAGTQSKPAPSIAEALANFLD
jgi:hypothetical protein